jgi:hypothetical protein
MSVSENFCNLLARRRTILNNRNAPIRREIDNPYTNANGTAKTDACGNQITSQMIYERRKAEILQYNNNFSVRGTLTRAQQYKQTVENIGRTSNKVVENIDGTTTTFGISNCFSDLYLPTSSSAAGIPGPPFTIQYRPEVPLHGYAVNTQPIGISNTDSLNAWSFNTGRNIQAKNGEWTTLLRIFHNIDNIDSEIINKNYQFNLDIPIGLYVAGDISGGFILDNSSNHIFISNVDVRITDSAGDVLSTPTVSNYFNDISMSDISMNYVIDNSSNFTAIRYMGNLPLTTTLPIQTLSYYEIQLRFDITIQDSNEYISLFDVDSYVSAAYMNITDNNVDLSNNIHSVQLISSGSTYYAPNFTDFTIVGTLQD